MSTSTAASALVHERDLTPNRRGLRFRHHQRALQVDARGRRNAGQHSQPVETVRDARQQIRPARLVDQFLPLGKRESDR